MDRETVKAMNALSKKINDVQAKLDKFAQRLHLESTKSIEANANDISDNRQGLTETFESTLTNADDVAINRQAIEELFEMITAESEVK